jgi:hypothetical protein
MKKNHRNIPVKYELLLRKETILLLSGIQLADVKAGVESGTKCDGTSTDSTEVNNSCVR